MELITGKSLSEALIFASTKVPSLKEVNFGKVKLWAVEHFWTDFDLRKRRDNKMGT